ncbi:MAG TPA: hypothetical protein VFV46_00070 [Lacibacter sp.]|nr:hypothetical protein [Lacibacter sp.]
MQLSFTVEALRVNSLTVKIAIPSLLELKDHYQQNDLPLINSYWAKIWPASKALAQFILEHPLLVADKKITEIAAGLGFPSLVAASLAREVICTEAIPDALEFIHTSIQLNDLKNIQASTFNWNHQLAVETDVLLMSDVNYNPAVFPQLLSFVQIQLQQGITILLSTPQRLMAKPFIASLAKYIVQQEEYEIKESGVVTMCSVFVLKTK